METDLANIKNAFVKAIKLEMDAIKSRQGSFEVPVRHSGGMEARSGRFFYPFTAESPTDRLHAGIQCSLRLGEREFPVEVNTALEGRLELASAFPLSVTPAQEALLVLYPWFLYEKLIAGIESLSMQSAGSRLALIAFGKLPARAHAFNEAELPPAILKEYAALNESQRSAVLHALGSELSFIWGPPGTGKTVTLCALVSACLLFGWKTLVVSTTNAAVDNAITKLSLGEASADFLQKGSVVRYGRSHPDVEAVNIPFILERINERALPEIERLKGEIADASTAIEGLRAAQGHLELQDEQMDLFAGNEGLPEPDALKGFSPDSPPDWRKLSLTERRQTVSEALARQLSEAEGLKALLAAAEKGLVKDSEAAIGRAKLAFATIAGLYSGDMLSRHAFDVVIVEEAGMAILPAVLYSLCKAGQRAVICGDPNQLPPVVNSEDAYARKAMARSVYEVGLEPGFTGSHAHLLDVQYRMHPQIGDLVSSLYYQGKLKNGVAASDRQSLADLLPNAGKAFTLVDLEGRSECAQKKGSYSRYNEESARRCIAIVKAIPPLYTVGIIAPYAAQVKLVRELLAPLPGSDSIECATVHKFQGSEKDVIVLDLTDSSPLPPGVLTRGKDAVNLLNVAVSRARGKLIVIAEADYFLARAPGSAAAELIRALKG